jgi:hypothetical protein
VVRSLGLITCSEKSTSALGRGSERGPLLEFNIGSHPGDSTHYVNAKDMLSLSLLQARLIDLGMPIKIVEDT